MTRALRLLTVLMLAFALAAFAGCGGGDDDPAGPTTDAATATDLPATVTTAAPGTVTVTVPTAAPGTSTTPTEPAPPQGQDSVLVYLVRGETLGVARRRITPTRGVAQAAMQELMTGPSPEEASLGLDTGIPAGARLNGVTIANGTATVDLTREFEAGGGSLSVRLRVAQVVATLTQFPTVRRVAFEIAGEPVDAIGGEGLVVDPPPTRADIEDLTPAILLESPAPGDVLTSPFRARGTSNVFEAQFTLQLVQEDGGTLTRPVMATSGTGTRGTFDAEVEFDVDAPTRATLRVFSDSPRDGSEINLVEIPVHLE